MRSSTIDSGWSAVKVRGCGCSRAADIDWADRFLKWTRFSRYENSNWIQ
jgi:hypothetical protein